MVEIELGIEPQFKELTLITNVQRWMYGASFGQPVPDLGRAAARLVDSGLALSAECSNQRYGTASRQMEILHRLDKKFADLAYPRVLRAELPPLKPRANHIAERVNDPNILNILQFHEYLLLHENGSMIFSLVLEFEEAEVPLRDAIRLAELGLESSLLDWVLPTKLSNNIDFDSIGKGREGNWIQGVSLEDYIDRIMLPTVAHLLFPRRLRKVTQSVHPLGQYTLNVVISSKPGCTSIDSFVREYGHELKSLSDMDLVGYTRASEVVEERFAIDYSIDGEVGVFLGHRAGTVIFEWPKIEDWFVYAKTRYHPDTDSRAVLALEIYQHYGIFVEWVLLEESSVRSFVVQLSAYARTPDISVEKVIYQKRRMVQELEEFRDGVTSFDFGDNIIRRLSVIRGIDELQTRFMEKRAIVEEIVVERANWRLQVLMAVLNVVLLASLMLELAELPLEYYAIQSGSPTWLGAKLMAVAVVPLLFVSYAVSKALLRWLAGIWTWLAEKGPQIRKEIRPVSNMARQRVSAAWRNLSRAPSTIVRQVRDTTNVVRQKFQELVLQPALDFLKRMGQYFRKRQ